MLPTDKLGQLGERMLLLNTGYCYGVNKPGKHSERVSEHISMVPGKAQTQTRIVASKTVHRISTDISDFPRSYKCTCLV